MISGGLFVQKRSVYHCQSFPAVYSQSGSFVSRVAIIRPPPKTSLHFYSCCVRPHSSGDKCALYVAKCSVILITSRVTVLHSLRMFNNLVQPNIVHGLIARKGSSHFLKPVSSRMSRVRAPTYPMYFYQF